MKHLTCVLLLAISGIGAAQAVDANRKTAAAAQETAKPVVKAEPSAPVVPGTIELKNRSSFVLEHNSRNPFWPIGWKPAAKVSNNSTEQAGPEISPSAFVVSSIMMGEGSRYAIINGKPMSEGQVFGLQMGTQVYQITVKTIEDGQVIMQRRDQQFAVPLRRR